MPGFSHPVLFNLKQIPKSVELDLGMFLLEVAFLMAIVAV
jgi:hypothetical protein